MPDSVTIAEFARAPSPGATLFRSGATSGSASEGRLIEYIFSDSSVALDGHRIMTPGWDLTSYMTNPVFCLSHDTTSPPIGRVISTRIIGDQLRGTVEYADAETYPLADTIFRLAKGGFMNACSVSWEPLEWRPATETGRAPGSIDFIRQQLLECSAVSVPALSTALITARAAGINTAPLIEFAEHALDTGGMILVPRSELETLRRTAGAAPMTQVIIPAADPPKRDLYDVSMVASLLQSLAYAQCNAAWEAEYEGDNSAVPGMLADACHSIGSILVAMTTEETSELLSGMVGVDAADANARKAVFGMIARRLVKRGAPKVRMGKVLSADNESALRDKHAAMKRSVDDMSGTLDDLGGLIDGMCGPMGEGDGGDLEDASLSAAAALKESRARAIRARRLRHQQDVLTSAP